jgi:hypothetical protein
MNQQLGKQALDQAEKLLRDAQDGAKAISEIGDTAWGSTKMLNEKIVQNVTANFEAAIAVAHSMTTAKSLPEIAKIQSEYLRKITLQATEQTKEFLDLSTRATQHVLEKVQDAATRSFR